MNIAFMFEVFIAFYLRSVSSPRNLVPVEGVVLDHCLGAIYDECWVSSWRGRVS
jgi:hypothetical protein